MAIVRMDKNTYVAESLYQWDKNQELTIYGLSFDKAPEIHFTNEAMEKTLVRQSSMDNAGVIMVQIPNSLLQKPYNIKAYICNYDGDTFETAYNIVIPMKARKMPADYTLTVSDAEVYSFNEMENYIESLVRSIEDHNAVDEELNAKYNAWNETLTEKQALIDSRFGDIDKAIENAIDEIETKLDDNFTEQISDAYSKLLDKITNVSNKLDNNIVDVNESFNTYYNYFTNKCNTIDSKFTYADYSYSVKTGGVNSLSLTGMSNYVPVSITFVDSDHISDCDYHLTLVTSGSSSVVKYKITSDNYNGTVTGKIRVLFMKIGG